MLRIIDGQIGAGKTYYAVDHVLRKYFMWSKELDEWVPKPSDVPVLVVTNISDCRLGESFDELVEKAGGLTPFFHVDHQREFCKGRSVVYIIDEAQKHFHRKYFDRDVFFFFQYHRHLGCDVYLITQDVSTLSSELRNLAEYYIQAARRSFSFAGEFRYQFKSGPREKAWKTTVRKRDPRVFAAYQSMVQREVEKSPSVARRFALIAVLLCLLTIGSFVWFLDRFGRPRGPAGAEAMGVGSPAASRAAAHAWLAWARSYTEGAEETAARGSPVRPESRPEVVPAPGGGWAADGFARVVGVHGDADAESGGVLLELEDGRRVAVSFAEMVLRCRCSARHLRAGLTVPVWRRADDVGLAGLPYAAGAQRSDERARSGAAPPAQTAGAATTVEVVAPMLPRVR